MNYASISRVSASLMVNSSVRPWMLSHELISMLTGLGQPGIVLRNQATAFSAASPYSAIKLSQWLLA